MQESQETVATRRAMVNEVDSNIAKLKEQLSGLNDRLGYYSNLVDASGQDNGANKQTGPLSKREKSVR